MKLDYNLYNGNRLQGIFLSRRKIIDYLLLHQTATKRELAEVLGITFAAVATHINSLLEFSLLASPGRVQKGVKRPTQEFVLPDLAEKCGAVSLSAEVVELLTVSLRGEILAQEIFPVSAPTQVAVLHALTQALHAAQHQKLCSVLISVDGIISAERAVWFEVNGVPDWDPCSPLQLLRNPVQNLKLGSVTRIRTLARGWGQELNSLDSLAVIEERCGKFKVATYQEAECNIGLIGTESYHFHFPIPGGSPCYCGQEHCWLARIHQGDFDSEFLVHGLQIVAQKLGVAQVAYCASDGPEPPDTIRPLTQLANVNEIHHSGLALLGAEQAWMQILIRNFAPEMVL